MAKKHDIDYEFDPVKYETNGKNAEKVVWTTKALEKAVDALNEGLPLKANPFIGKVTQLLKPDLVYRRTPEEIEDYIKCKQDPVYFAEKCFLMTPEGLQKCKMRDYQVDYLHHLQEHRFSVLLSCRQAGKTLSLMTNITIKISKNDNRFVKMLKKYYFYINNNDYIITLPLFELYNILCNKSLLWKIKYNIYKLLLWLEKKDKKSIETNA